MPRPKTASDEKRLKMKAKEGMRSAKDPIERLRFACLSRGTTGIKGLARLFKIVDDDGSRSLNFEEFKEGVHDYGLTFDDEELKGIFNTFDADDNGSINFDEFLENLRPPMSKNRIKMITQAFEKLDKTNDGVITVEDVQNIYDVRKHPKYMNGEWDEEQCLLQYLGNFDSKEKDGKITHEEFLNYYSGVSASIDDDAYFDLMMRQAWRM